MKRDFRDFVGIAHVGGKYRFTSDNNLKEGVDVIASTGTRVIKLWFDSTSTTTGYIFNSTWPTVTNLTQLAQTPYYQYAFTHPQLRTYFLVTTEYSFGQLDNFNATNCYNELYNAAVYFLTNPAFEGKTFVFQNYEGDNALGFDANTSAATVRSKIDGMIAYWNGRQNAVTAARNAYPNTGVTILCAGEVNQIPVDTIKFAWPLAVDEVVPYTNMDLYSLSSWACQTSDSEWLLPRILDYYNARTPGSDNIMIGGYGAPEKNWETNYVYSNYSDEQQFKCVKRQTEAAIRWGVKYFLYWQIYCNEVKVGGSSTPGVDTLGNQLNGLWLRRPDGSYNKLWYYFLGLLKSQDGGSTYKTPAGNQIPKVAQIDPNGRSVLSGHLRVQGGRGFTTKTGTRIEPLIFLDDSNSIAISRMPKLGQNQYRNYRLVWQEQWNDLNNWNIETGPIGGGQVQEYTSNPANVKINNNMLEITVLKEAVIPPSGRPYSSGRINTMKKFSFKYGRKDVRARTTSALGLSAAIWMMGDNYWGGNFTMNIRYSNGSGSDRPLEIKVNTTVISASQSFPDTGGWDKWKFLKDIPVQLKNNSNSIIFTTIGSNGPNIDFIELIDHNNVKIRYQAESATLSGATTSTTYSGYDGSGYAIYNNATGDTVTFSQTLPGIQWPSCGEIDIHECPGRTNTATGAHTSDEYVWGTAHFSKSGAHASAQSGRGVPVWGGLKADTFHTYSVDWDENRIIWYIDEYPYHELYYGYAGCEFAYSFRQPFWLLLNVGVGGPWPESIDALPDETTPLPATFYVDCISVYQKY